MPPRAAEYICYFRAPSWWIPASAPVGLVIIYHEALQWAGQEFNMPTQLLIDSTVQYSTCFFSLLFSHLYFLDKPWSQVSSLLPPGSCLQLLIVQRVQRYHCSSHFSCRPVPLVLSSCLFLFVFLTNIFSSFSTATCLVCWLVCFVFFRRAHWGWHCMANHLAASALLCISVS